MLHVRRYNLFPAAFNLSPESSVTRYKGLTPEAFNASESVSFSFRGIKHVEGVENASQGLYFLFHIRRNARHIVSLGGFSIFSIRSCKSSAFAFVKSRVFLRIEISVLRDSISSFFFSTVARRAVSSLTSSSFIKT